MIFFYPYSRFDLFKRVWGKYPMFTRWRSKELVIMPIKNDLKTQVTADIFFLGDLRHRFGL